MQRKTVQRLAAASTAAAVGLAAWSGLAQADEPPIRVVDESSVQVDDRIRINAKPGAQVISYHLVVQPGAQSAWHYHPGPHLVSVRSGTVKIYETDCSSRTYRTGTGFFDPGATNQPHIHMLRNPGPGVAEVVITDVRTDDLRKAIVVDPQPATCPG